MSDGEDAEDPRIEQLEEYMGDHRLVHPQHAPEAVPELGVALSSGDCRVRSNMC
jgi:hypothetical protein